MRLPDMKEVPHRLPSAGRMGEIALFHLTPGVSKAQGSSGAP